jgi:heme exporter protein A
VTAVADYDSISLIDVTRNFGRRRVLSRVSATFRSGEIVALVGPNGSGKSTFLSILATLMVPTAGNVRYGTLATPRHDAREVRASIGWLGHEVSLYPELTARENLEFFAAMYDVPAASTRVEAALTRARLTDRADDPISAYSRGMRQRLALERALLHEPSLVLLDEPFTGLDDGSAAMLVERLRGLGKSGCIVVVATHDFDVTEGLFDRAVVLRDGKLSELSTNDLRGSYRDHIRAGAAAPRG